MLLVCSSNVIVISEIFSDAIEVFDDIPAKAFCSCVICPVISPLIVKLPTTLVFPLIVTPLLPIIRIFELSKLFIDKVLAVTFPLTLILEFSPVIFKLETFKSEEVGIFRFVILAVPFRLVALIVLADIVEAPVIVLVVILEFAPIVIEVV